MPKILFTKEFFRETVEIFRQRPLKEIIFGKKVDHDDEGKQALEMAKSNEAAFRDAGGRHGSFIKLDVFHKASGEVYLVPDTTEGGKQSLLVFDDQVKIVPGPDLYVYISTKKDIKKEGLGDYIDLGLLKGTKGGQTYSVVVSASDLEKYQSVVIWCKQFSVLFSYAILE